MFLVQSMGKLITYKNEGFICAYFKTLLQKIVILKANLNMNDTNFKGEEQANQG